ncbi:Flavodoxin [Eubacterium pyruvativorans]|uniref:Flavodoxin n=1 Tax=Eubacterium pyruvativorans TaxID=155865 RepID=A0A1I7HKE6_9FIRM|nr:flavodoxin [Eubacterium pyruvativorans]SFO27898.1 Flavodoxin [Eubacterium pyruvativorans]SFU60926.1 Flavodoxin [Eubacterium pyruvativorans]
MKKVLVTYFSASGVTAGVAEKLAAGARVTAGERFAADVSESALASWAEEWL